MLLDIMYTFNDDYLEKLIYVQCFTHLRPGLLF